MSKRRENGYNLFNKDNVSETMLMSGGLEANNADWRTSEFIQVKELTNYLFYWKSTSNYFQLNIGLYDESKNFLQLLSQNSQNLFKKEFQTSEGCKYIKVSYSINVSGEDAGRSEIMLVEGTEEKPYEEYGAMPSLDYPSEVRAVGDNMNILPNEAVSTSNNGVDFTVNDDKSIQAVGTATANAQLILAGQMSSTEEIMKLRKGIQYKNVGNVDILYRNTNLNYARLQAGKIFTVDEDVSIGCWYLQVNVGVTVDETYYPKLVEYYEGMDESYSQYEQGSVEVKKLNSNIMPISNLGIDWEYTENAIKNLKQNTGTEISVIKIKKGQTIKIRLQLFSKPVASTTFSCLINGVENANMNFSRINVYFNLNQIYERSYTAEEDVTITYKLFGNSENETFEFQLWTNLENAEDYQRYEESSYVLPIQKPMLKGDYFDLERDKEVHHFDKYVSTSSDNWLLTSDVEHRFILNGNIDNCLNTENQYCSHSSECITWGNVEGTFSVRTNTNGTSLIYFCSSKFSTAEEFNQFVAEQEEAGTPLTFWYEVEEYELDLTEEQITVLNELQNVILYDDTTNIILPDVYPILDYDVSKIIDTTTTFEASLDSNGYFVVPDYDIKCLISYSESDIPSMPEAVETSVSVPGRDGDIPLNTIYNPLSFTIVCYTEDNLTPEEKYAEETKMNKFLNSIKNNTIKLKLESKGKYYNVKYNGQLNTTNYPKHLQFSIPLKSSSSYAKDIDESYILGNGEKESNTIKEVGAVFVIEGPAQTPKISLNDYEMFYDNVLLSNTKLVIDSNKSTITMINREGTATNAMRYYNHEFPKIQNGNNVLKVLSGIDEDRQVNVRWFDLKL